MNAQKRLNPKIISLIVIVLVALATTGVYAVSQGSNTTQQAETGNASETSSNTQQPATDSESAGSTATTGTYTDGTYTETGNYNTPGGSESVTVTLTLANGTVTDVTTTGSATGGNSARYQSAFLSGYKSLVIGKPIDSLSLSRVAGSSLTSNGFNDAIDQIKDDASA